MLAENNLDEAEKSFRKSLEIDERLGDKENAASSMMSILDSLCLPCLLDIEFACSSA